MSRLPGYTTEDNEFYDRAISNYDRGEGDAPGRWPDRPQNDVPLNYVGAVTVKRDGRVTHTQQPYKGGELLDVIEQGRDRPRTLSPEAHAKANAERRSYREQCQWFETWARSAFGVRRVEPFAVFSTEYIPE